MLNLRLIGFVYRALPRRQLAQQLHSQINLGEIAVTVIAAFFFALLFIGVMLAFGTLGIVTYL